MEKGVALISLRLQIRGGDGAEGLGNLHERVLISGEGRRRKRYRKTEAWKSSLRKKKIRKKKFLSRVTGFKRLGEEGREHGTRVPGHSLSDVQ